MPDPPRKLHLGSWTVAPPTWINIDASWGARLAKHPRLRRAVAAARLAPTEVLETEWPPDILVHDLRKPLPFPDGYAGAVYGSHVLEHLWLAEAERLLAECFRVLEPGGVLRIVVPDLRAIVQEYLGENPFGTQPNDREAELVAADRMVERLSFRGREPPRGGPLYRLYASLVDLHSHKWMYDFESLALRFRQHGFVDVREMGFEESRIDGIGEVELRHRVVDECGICVEGVKP